MLYVITQYLTRHTLHSKPDNYHSVLPLPALTFCLRHYRSVLHFAHQRLVEPLELLEICQLISLVLQALSTTVVEGARQNQHSRERASASWEGECLKDLPSGRR